jgi:CBS domain-containing protein
MGLSSFRSVLTSVSGDRELATALTTMANESISSLPVVDNHNNVIGNISQVDVKVGSIDSMFVST